MSTRKNARGALSTTASDILVAPAGGAMITLIHVANVHSTNSVNVTVQWTDASDGAVTRLCVNSAVNVRDAISVPGGGLLLEAGDKIQALASAAGSAEITVCYMVGG